MNKDGSRPIEVTVEGGKVYIEHEGAWGESPFIEAFTPEQAEELADRIKAAAQLARR